MVLEQAERESKRNLGISPSVPDVVNKPINWKQSVRLVPKTR